MSASINKIPNTADSAIPIKGTLQCGTKNACYFIALSLSLIDVLLSTLNH